MYVCCKVALGHALACSPQSRTGESARHDSKQQARTDATRRRLIAAAERIFARDGFEAARLEDIAAQAGYTRGAFYANFEDKEDIFFALLEQYVVERVEEVNALVQRYTDPEDRLQALRSHYARIAEDRRVALLSLEFKLFAIRHSEAHARLRARLQSMRLCGGDFLRRITKGLRRTPRFPAEAAVPALARFPMRSCSNICSIQKRCRPRR